MRKASRLRSVLFRIGRVMVVCAVAITLVVLVIWAVSGSSNAPTPPPPAVQAAPSDDGVAEYKESLRQAFAEVRQALLWFVGGLFVVGLGVLAAVYFSSGGITWRSRKSQAGPTKPRERSKDRAYEPGRYTLDDLTSEE